MNRRKFLLVSGLAAAGAAGPVLLRWTRTSGPGSPLSHPGSLARVLDEQTMRSVGAAYRSTTPAENGAQELTRLLLSNPDGPMVPADNDAAVRRMLERRVHDDFEAGRVVVVNGWILAVTEARQCALLSMAEKTPA